MSKNIEFNANQIPEAGTKILGFIKKHAVVIFIVSLLSIYGFLIFQINSLSNSEPNEEQIAEQLNTIKRPKLNEDTLKKIEQLESENVAVKALFKKARDNPFQD